MAELKCIYGQDKNQGLVLIFVHGLGGDLYETWMSDAKDKTTYWPSWVAEDCDCTTWTLGYDASLSAWKDNAMPLPVQGDSVLDCLSSEPKLKNRPLLLIGHSLGGLLIKTVMIAGLTKGVPRYSELIEHVCGVVFIATPHNGAELANLAQAVKFLLRPNEQVGDLTVHNAHLTTLHQQFLAQHNKSPFPVRTFAEEKPVSLGKMVVERGNAATYIPNEISIPLFEDHFSICKPKSREAQIHKSLIAFIREVKSSQKIVPSIPIVDAERNAAIFNVPVPRNPFFTGRGDILENLHKTLHEQHQIALKPSERATALSGLGGVGKTQTAAEYAHRYKDDYLAVLWVLADGEDLLRSSFAQLSVLLGFQAEKQDDQILAVQSWLRNNDGWLLIFDNAETLALLTAAKDLLPSDFNGHVLFTTRAQATGSLASVPVDCFDDDTGAVFLLRRSKWVDRALAALEQVRSSVSDTDWQTATILVHELGGLALAIDQAGAYIEQTECGLEGYLARYRNNAAAMLKERGYVQSADHPEAVYKTFLLALENAEKRHPLAGEILRDSALLHPDGISEKLYADCDPLDLDKALAALKDYSLIQRVPERKLFTVHRLVQVVIRDVCDG